MDIQVLALLVALSFTLSIVAGKMSIRRGEINFNKTVAILNGRKTPINWYNPLATKPNEPASIYNNKLCKNCLMCMEKATEAYIATHKNVLKHNSVEFNNAIAASDGENIIREKRTTKNKLQKGKKLKKSKNPVVTKYNRDGTVSVLKVKEILFDDAPSCNVYSVTETHACQSPEGIALLATVKKSKSKRDEPQTVVHEALTTTKKPNSSVVHTKPGILNLSFDNIQFPDNIMGSFEEYF